MRRIIKPTEVAERLGHSRPWFYAHRRRLEQLGFPQKDAELRGYDTIAVDNWLDRRANIISQSSVEEQMLEILNGKTHA